ncbi:MAG: hypothetical protein H6728_15335 [Myxococcales bacterium]|nr:hypothetical protein [Myxococcales bacterium]
MQISSPFLFLTCQPGAEALVKADVQQRHPSLRFAFSRPGYLTFKSESALSLDLPRPSVFARRWGLSFGWKPDLSQAWDEVHTLFPQAPDLVHLFVREGEASDNFPEEIARREDELFAQMQTLTQLPLNKSARNKQCVIDLIEVDPGRIAIGAHLQKSPQRASVAGRPPFRSIPTEAPSRVWGKISEALWRTNTKITPNDVILDLGCAPGGGTSVLLDAGARVFGVDPAEMHPSVLKSPRFTHLPLVMERLELKALSAAPTGFVYDINLNPKMMLPPLNKLLLSLPSLRWGLITLKLNQPSLLRELDWMLKKIRTAGFQHLFVEQLHYNRQELFCFASKSPTPLTQTR